MQKNYITLFLLLLFCVGSAALNAQEATFDNGKKYIIGGIEVKGVKSYNTQTVLTYTGLRKGEVITIPGERITEVINKLWKLELFSDIEFYLTDVQGETAFLELVIEELPTLSEVKFQGIKKQGKIDDIVKETDLKKGKKLTESFLTNTKNFIDNKYRKVGYLNVKTSLFTSIDTTATNAVNMIVNVDLGEKVKIGNINFEGNDVLSDGKLRKQMKNTKKKFFGRFWKKSKFIEDDYKEDLVSVVDKYKEKGYRDARIITDTVAFNKDENTLDVTIKVQEGDQYYFGDITYLGNSSYTNAQLNQVLGIKKGDVYNGVLLKKQIADDSKPDANDLTNLYQNSGYLFSSINPVEVSAENDTINFEVRIIEGKRAKFNKITVVGNDKTNDHVIYREIRTKPGALYRKDDVVRSVRELGQLGFFDPEQVSPNFKNPNPNDGTIDIEYGLVERGSSQIELQGGFGGGGFIGTLGLSFNNFAVKDLFKKEAYKPLPMGDGQTLSLRLQASQFFQTYSFSFSEPWLGGKQPVSFSTSLSRTTQFLFNQRTRRADKDRKFIISGITVGLAKVLQVPDDNFILSQSLSFQSYEFENYQTGLFNIGANGTANNLAYTVDLTRQALSGNLIFPLYGSKFSINAKFTLPYSLWNGVDYANLADQEEFQLKDANGNVLTDNAGIPLPDSEKIEQEKVNWLEFYKIKFKGDWYTRLVDKLVLKSSAEFAFLGAYNQDRGVIPFERFALGGDGLGQFNIGGTEAVGLRGYPNQSLNPIITDPVTGQQSNNDGATIYNKFSLELRYPLTLKPAASIYGLTFLEAGAAFNNFKDYNPFELQRSAGLGVRIFMPAFGLLGIDFGYGFDPLPGQTQRNGWETHFIIGQQF
ncbi:outer membrane protein assembly factor BamA [Spongiivirga citrea]|uniref:Outer membrane protein assembly factor BamA n=1 Tax=Spongiivirga citrea TaxID=1481457 RepID=A0A6M0CKG6_9FLAO|nr:outer membrane protein assembly factor BamA [Spongiivirga citrea]NER18142.1 outer membrane protein assembly factor BamA [Spongiivirga citrea]